MDKFWSIFCMPIGLFLCFGPGLVVWLLTRDKESGANQGENKK